jgi:demethylmenaquinone methyltransferase/2-methoxy-6-polyprenyl-1,4-benzoquinol methylase
MSSTPLPSPKDKERFVRAMFDDISVRYDLVNRIMTFGVDQSWRKKAISRTQLRSGETLVDVASGTGDFLVIAQKISDRLIGIDLSLGMLRYNRSQAPLVQGSALCLPLKDQSVDVITCGFALRNFKEIEPVFKEFHRVLKIGGRLAIIEVSKPPNPLVGSMHEVYFNKIVPAIGALFSKASAYRYLPASVSYLPSPKDLVDMLRSAGFSGVTRQELTLGVAQMLLARKDKCIEAK